MRSSKFHVSSKKIDLKKYRSKQGYKCLNTSPVYKFDLYIDQTWFGKLIRVIECKQYSDAITSLIQDTRLSDARLPSQCE